MTASSRIYVPERLKRQVAIHAMAWAARETRPELNIPQLLILAGESGAGKTASVMSVLREIGVHIERLPSSTLAGPYEGQASGPLRDAYLATSKQEGAFTSAIFIDEFDSSVASVRQDAANSPNGPQLASLVMTQCDNPFEMTMSSATGKTIKLKIERPPFIVMTVNDLSKVYEPIKQSGRARIVEWAFEPDELRLAVGALYPSLSDSEVQGLIGRFPNLPIAFFAQLGNRAIDQRIDELIGSRPLGTIGKLPFWRIAEQIDAFKAEIGLDDLVRAGDAFAAISKDKSYLKRSKSVQAAPALANGNGDFSHDTSAT